MFIPVKNKELSSDKSILTSFKAKKFDKEFSILFSSNKIEDIINVEHLLKNNGINYILIDEHATSLMRFVPGLETRILVSNKDIERSVKLLQSL